MQLSNPWKRINVNSEISLSNKIGVVIIGRNEGERLLLCLKSITGQTKQIVYVDSDSTDNSVENAKSSGAHVVALDMAIPFSAARARNEGFYKIRQLYSQVEFVQFMDGDCEMNAEWLKNSFSFLQPHPDVAVVCGRRRERFPERSIYNQLCDIEWDTPVGETKACGGDALIRVDSFEMVDGFRQTLIAGEEPELCVRLRAKGWKIWRLDFEMTLHDAAMFHFKQWWKRNIRSGYAFAEGAFLHGKSDGKHWVRESRRSLIWGLIFPVLAFVLIICFGYWGLLLLLIYPIQVIRIALLGSKTEKIKWLYAFFLVVGKFPEVLGQIKFYFNNYFNITARLIEYK